MYICVNVNECDHDKRHVSVLITAFPASCNVNIHVLIAISQQTLSS